MKSNKSIEFPEKLCPAMAGVTHGFSFAFLQECFVATLLVLAREEDEAASRPFDEDNDDLDDYKLWVVFKEQAKILRKEVESQKGKHSQLTEWLRVSGSSDESAQSVGISNCNAEHCHASCHCRERNFDKGNERARARKNEILPELPWYDQKSEYLNSAAIELRL